MTTALFCLGAVMVVLLGLAITGLALVLLEWNDRRRPDPEREHDERFSIEAWLIFAWVLTCVFIEETTRKVLHWIRRLV